VSRAAKLLEWASPPERAMPPLSDLRPAAPRWRTPVAWAATIVIALGVGVYGGKKVLTPTNHKDQIAERQEQRAATAPVTAAPVVVSGDTARGQRDAEGLVTAPAPPAKAPALMDSSPAAVSALANRADVDSLAKRRFADSLTRSLAAAATDRVADVAVRRDSATPAPPPAPAPAVAARESRALAQAPVAAARPNADSTPVRLEGVVVTSAPEQNRTRGAALLSTAWPVITRDSASRLLRGPIVALPDLPINAVRASNDAVVVEHVVPPGQVIRLVERRATLADEAAGRSAKTSNESLARYVGGLRVEISGPFAADSLSKLLDKVRVIP